MTNTVGENERTVLIVMPFELLRNKIQFLSLYMSFKVENNKILQDKAKTLKTPSHTKLSSAFYSSSYIRQQLFIRGSLTVGLPHIPQFPHSGSSTSADDLAKSAAQHSEDR